MTTMTTEDWPLPHPQIDWQWRWELSAADREAQQNVVRRLRALVDRYHSEGGGPVDRASLVFAQTWLVAAATADAGPPDRLSIGEGEVIIAEWVKGYSVDEYEFRPDGLMDVCSWNRVSEQDPGTFSHATFAPAVAACSRGPTPELTHPQARTWPSVAHTDERSIPQLTRYDVSGAHLREAA